MLNVDAHKGPCPWDTNLLIISGFTQGNQLRAKTLTPYMVLILVHSQEKNINYNLREVQTAS